MNDSRHYQRKRQAEQSKSLANRHKQKISNDTIMAVTVLVLLLGIIVILFVMQWNALEAGRKECEAKGGEWYSASTGKITITRCEFEE